MKFIFIDDFHGKENKNIFGISVILMDLGKYNTIRNSLLSSLKKNNWNNEEEFKGRYLFCRNPAGQTKSPEEMINLTREIMGWFSSKKNTRASVFYSFNDKGQSVENFCELIKKIIPKLPSPISQQGGKHIAVAYFDYFDGCHKPENATKINSCIFNELSNKGYVLVEKHATPVQSSNETAGIVYADVCAYLCSWLAENPKKTECDLVDLIEHTHKEKTNIVHDIYSVVNIKKI